MLRPNRFLPPLRLIAPPRTILLLLSRHASTHRPRTPRRTFRTIGLVSAGALLALTLSSPPIRHDNDADESKSPPTNDFADASLGALVRSYVVYTMCSIPALVDNSPKLLQIASLPVIRWFAEPFIRITFFNHFIGGDTAEQTLPVLYKLRSANKGALLPYNVEVDHAKATSSSSSSLDSSTHKLFIEETIHSIDVAADFEDQVAGPKKTGRRTWVPIKLSALLPDADALVKLSAHIIHTRPQRDIHVPFPGCPHQSDLDVLYKSTPPATTGKDTERALTPQDIASLQELHEDLRRICTRAKERGVKLLVDAEYSWYQPAIDALTLALTREFNSSPSSSTTIPSSPHNVQPLIYGTYQAYLRRTPAHLALALADAQKQNYALGVKLVRGAYHPYESAAHATRNAGSATTLCLSDEADPPVWRTKTETDACYDACVRVLVGAVRDDVERVRQVGGGARVAVAVIFGTHNWKSCEGILGALVRGGLARTEGREGESVLVLEEETTERVAVAQLFGMSDDLTSWLVRRTVSETPFVMKCVPYGALSEVMPYLGRRAIENKSVLGEGTAAKERRRAGREIRRRVVGLFGFGGV